MRDENYLNGYVNSANEYFIGSDVRDERPPKLYFDDLKVGQVFHSSEYYVSADEIAEFSIKYDPQPFHIDDDLAKDSIFRGLAASGWHTVSITMNLLVKSLPLAHGIIGKGVEKINWLRPTRPGDILRIRAKITEIDISPAKPDRALMTIHISTIGQDNKIRQELLGKLLIFQGSGTAKTP
ncbi:MaoC family dehydratase [Dickeya fangzhongdai]|uniref:MaoC family dehydratase n=1 Tax=Dickeya fangzhongdai TaxID=1778540 RepID=UPI001ADBA9A6|nr:MaoC family dehydratase [Dickeya fangzhongdai]MBO8134675.1 MaoC family dehydratase [Dickeya fangzhongdai]